MSCVLLTIHISPHQAVRALHIPAAAIIKTHFECLRAFLLFLLSPAVVLSSISEINMYANYTEVQQLPYGIRECSNAEF